MKNEKGSITLFVVISIMFMLIIVLSLYVSSSNKIQSQERELEKIQQSYKTEDIDELYIKAYQSE